MPFVRLQQSRPAACLESGMDREPKNMDYCCTMRARVGVQIQTGSGSGKPTITASTNCPPAGQTKRQRRALAHAKSAAAGAAAGYCSL